MKRTLFAIPLLTLSLSPVSLSYEATDSSYDSSIPTRISKVKGVTGTTLIDDGKLLHVPDNSAQDTTEKDPSPDCLVSEDDLIKNDEDPVSSTGTGLYANQSFHSETWGAIGHYYLIEISNITSVTRAYSHFGYFYEKTYWSLEILMYLSIATLLIRSRVGTVSHIVSMWIRKWSPQSVPKRMCTT